MKNGEMKTDGVKKRIAVLASGNGSNAEAIIRYFNRSNSSDSQQGQNETSGLNEAAGEVALVICNRKEAKVYERAARLGVPAIHVPKTLFADEAYLTDLLKGHHIDFIVLAGFLLMIPDFLLRLYPNRIVNLHPSLLPKYGGKGMYGDKVHEAVVADGETETGITVHYVSEECDGGDIIFQAATDVKPEDTPADVAAKVHALEYQHYPRVIATLL